MCNTNRPCTCLWICARPCRPLRMGLTTSTAVQPLEGALMLPSRTTLQPKQAVRARCVQLHGGTECQQRWWPSRGFGGAAIPYHPAAHMCAWAVCPPCSPCAHGPVPPCSPCVHDLPHELCGTETRMRVMDGFRTAGRPAHVGALAAVSTGYIRT